jgi:hypothetical protein
LLGIEFPFLSIRFSRGDDANHLCAARFSNGVRNKQDQFALDRANGSLSMLTAIKSILQRKRKWIDKHQRRRVETHAMFSNIRSSFVSIPFKANRHNFNVTTFLSQQYCFCFPSIPSP